MTAWSAKDAECAKLLEAMVAGKISHEGDESLRRLLVLGATSWLRQVKANPEKGSPWLRGMLARRPTKVVAVAQAARTARILWAMLSHNQPYRAPAIG